MSFLSHLSFSRIEVVMDELGGSMELTLNKELSLEERYLVTKAKL